MSASTRLEEARYAMQRAASAENAFLDQGLVLLPLLSRLGPLVGALGSVLLLRDALQLADVAARTAAVAEAMWPFAGGVVVAGLSFLAHRRLAPMAAELQRGNDRIADELVGLLADLEGVPTVRRADTRLGRLRAVWYRRLKPAYGRLMRLQFCHINCLLLPFLLMPLLPSAPPDVSGAALPALLQGEAHVEASWTLTLDPGGEIVLIEPRGAARTVTHDALARYVHDTFWASSWRLYADAAVPYARVEDVLEILRGDAPRRVHFMGTFAGDGQVTEGR